MTKRADVVIARFPYAGGSGSKVRPAEVVQCDRLNAQIQNTLLAMVTGNTRLVGTEPTQFLIDPATPEGASSGLTQASAVKCENLATVPQSDIIDRLQALNAKPQAAPAMPLAASRFSHFAENLYTVVCRYVSPGRRIVEGKSF